jgi:hypothetical protein
MVQQFLSLADALARRFQQRFAGLIELDDARQVARYELIRAAACLKPGCCTTAAYLKQRIHGALQHYLRDHGRLVRVSRREHEKGIHPWGHQSLDALGADERPYLYKLASPEREAPASKGLGFPLKRCCRGFRPTKPRSCAYGCWRAGRCGASQASWGSAR